MDRSIYQCGSRDLHVANYTGIHTVNIVFINTILGRGIPKIVPNMQTGSKGAIAKFKCYFDGGKVNWMGFHYSESKFSYHSLESGSHNLVFTVTGSTTGRCEYHNVEYRIRLYDIGDLFLTSRNDIGYQITRSYIGVFNTNRKNYII